MIFMKSNSFISRKNKHFKTTAKQFLYEKPKIHALFNCLFCKPKQTIWLIVLHFVQSLVSVLVNLFVLISINNKNVTV